MCHCIFLGINPCVTLSHDFVLIVWQLGIWFGGWVGWRTWGVSLRTQTVLCCLTIQALSVNCQGRLCKTDLSGLKLSVYVTGSNLLCKQHIVLNHVFFWYESSGGKIRGFQRRSWIFCLFQWGTACGYHFSTLYWSPRWCTKVDKNSYKSIELEQKLWWYLLTEKLTGSRMKFPQNGKGINRN